jgi:N-succinyldiaminopimelate aminotransferase
VLHSSGTYFLTADARPLGFDDAVALCERLPHEAGVVAIPLSAFTADPERVRPLVRFAFCKQHKVLEDAVGRLAAWGAARR